jgi:Reverse transcriptase (RNA-dependent DNA polymerase)/Integrase core domain/gag-polypeptide of LTR copia-type/GAG-pre-integrase domain
MTDNSKLTSYILTGSNNYVPWARSVEIGLGGKGKLHFINGSKEKPKPKDPVNPTTDEKTTIENWETSDQLIMSWLLSTMDTKISSALMYCKTAREIWTKAKTRYGQGKNFAHIFALKQELSNIKQGNLTNSDLVTELLIKWEELQMYLPETENPEEIHKRNEHELIYTYLGALDSSFEPIRAQILSSAEMPTFDDVVLRVEQEDTRRRLMNPSFATNTENQAFRATYTKDRGKGNLWCDHCKRSSHNRESCWVLQPHLKPQRNNRGGGGANTGGWRREAHSAIGEITSGGTNAKEKGAGEINPNTALYGPPLFNPSGPASSSGPPLFYPPGSSGPTGSSGPPGPSGQAGPTGSSGPTSDQLTKLVNQLNQLLQPRQNYSGLSELKLSNNSMYLNKNQHDSNWIIDSGATHHMSCNPNKFLNLVTSSKPQFVTTANGGQTKIFGTGTISVLNQPANEALYLPDFHSNLLSVNKIVKDLNCAVIFLPEKVIFQDRISGNMIGEGILRNGLYYLEENNKCFASSKNNDRGYLLHLRFGHPSDQVLNRLFHYNYDSSSCDTCRFAKQTRLPFPTSITKVEKCFDLIHSDVWGPSPVESYNHYKYYVTFIDDFSKTTWVYLLKTKNEVFSCFQEFFNFITNQYNAQVKVFRSDNGTEYMNKDFTIFFKQHGILHQTTCIHTPQQNGVSERKNRHLLEKTRALLLQNNVPKKFWSDAILTATYLINRLPSPNLNNLSPLEILKGRKIDLDHIRVFGCTCFVYIKRKDKLDKNSVKTIFLGYSSTKKGYKCFDPEQNKLYISRDIVFREHEPFFTPAHDTTAATPSTLQFLSPSFDNEENPSASSSGGDYADERNNTEDRQEEEGEEDAIRRRSTRTRQPSTRLRDFVSHQVLYPIQDFINYNKVSPTYQTYLSKLDGNNEPNSYDEAKQQTIWIQAMNEELKALEQNNTWDMVELPKGKKPVGCKWVYKIKYNSDGTVERYKARLVAKGFTQTYGIDYQETFAPVAKMNTFRILMSIATNHGWDLFQMDVKNAFLQGDLEEEVYMTPPPGYCETSKVCKLRKAIYGLKQSPRAWYAKLSTFLIEHNFKKSTADCSVFIEKNDNSSTIILVYVDDIIITGNNNQRIKEVKEMLKGKFDIKDLGKLSYFLGIEIAHSTKGLFLSQRKYTLDLLKETGKLGTKPATSPMETNIKLNTEDGKPLSDISQYQRIVGKLIYLTVTRPDITFAVSTVSQFMHAPRTCHMEAINRILRYLKGTPGQGILMKQNATDTVVGFSDADWAGSCDRKSTTGFCTFVGGNLVTWRSKKQNVVARSSAEAEYRAMASTASELIWIKHLLHDMLIESPEPIQMFCDNQAARHIASNPVFHERTKHIEVDCHFIRDKVQSKEIAIPFIRSQEQLADIFTKALDKKTSQQILNKLGSYNLYEPNLRGSIEINTNGLRLSKSSQAVIDCT